MAGSSTLELIEQVVTDGECLPDAQLVVWESLNTLIELSLLAVSHDGASQVQRYRLLESPRAYAREKLEAAGELQRVRHLHMACMASYLDTCWKNVFSGTVALDALYASVEPDFDNARQAWRAACDAEDTASALRIAAGLLLLLPESRMDESKCMAEHCEAMLRARPGTDPALALRVWLSVAYVRRVSAPKRLRVPAEQALQLARQLDDLSSDRLPLYLALCMKAMADAIERDEGAAREAIDELQRIVDPRWPAHRRAVLAATEELYARRCTFDTGARLRVCRQWIALDLERGFLRSTAAVNLIDCELAAGHAEDAVRAARRVLASLQGTRNKLGLAHARLHLAAALLALGRVDVALPVCRDGWAHALRFDMQAPWADLLAELAARQGRPEAAARLLGYAEVGYRRRLEGREYTHVKSQQQTLALVHERLGNEAMRQLHLDGEALQDDEVALLAFGDTDAGPVISGAS